MDNIRVASKAEIACYYSDLASEEKRSIIDRIKNRKLRLLFISPEALIKNRWSTTFVCDYIVAYIFEQCGVRGKKAVSIVPNTKWNI